MQYRTDINGNITEFVRDTNGNNTKIINPDKSFKEYNYDSNTNNVLWARDEEGNFIRYYYNADNTLQKKAKYLKKLLTGTVDLIDTVGATGYNKDDFSVEEYNYYAYNETTFKVKGLTNEKIDSLGNKTVFEYQRNNTNGVGNYNVSRITNAESTAQNNISTLFEYNSIGLKSAEVTSMGYRTDYEYNNNGQLERVTRYTVPNPSAADKLDPLKKEITRTVYDGKGRKTQEISPKEYDASKDGLNSEPKNHSYSDVNVGYRYIYNNNDTISSVTDPMGNVNKYLIRAKNIGIS